MSHNLTVTITWKHTKLGLMRYEKIKLNLWQTQVDDSAGVNTTVLLEE